MWYSAKIHVLFKGCILLSTQPYLTPVGGILFKPTIEAISYFYTPWFTWDSLPGQDCRQSEQHVHGNVRWSWYVSYITLSFQLSWFQWYRVVMYPSVIFMPPSLAKFYPCQYVHLYVHPTYQSCLIYMEVRASVSYGHILPFVFVHYLTFIYIFMSPPLSGRDI